MHLNKKNNEFLRSILNLKAIKTLCFIGKPVRLEKERVGVNNNIDDAFANPIEELCKKKKKSINKPKALENFVSIYIKCVEIKKTTKYVYNPKHL